MTVENGNFRNMATPSKIDTEYRYCVFAHDQPIDDAGKMVGNRLFPGDDTPRTFIKCNLVNCEPPPGSTLIKCNTTIVENKKQVSVDSVVIDGLSLDAPVFENWIHGHYKDGLYIYHPEPIKKVLPGGD